MLNKCVSLTAESLHSSSLSGSDKKGLLGFLKFNRRKSKVEHRLTCTHAYTHIRSFKFFVCLNLDSAIVYMYESCMSIETQNDLDK